MNQIEDVTYIEVELLIQAVYSRFQYDFRLYSRSSLQRRLTQALIRFHLPNISRLTEKLLHEPSFFTKLLDYLTVSTTEMFRDPSYFKSFRNNVVPFLQTFPSIKIWVAGCSSGEEVYSFAIILKEAGMLHKSIIYATDINPHNLEKAKKGIYSIDSMQEATRNYQASGGEKSLSDYYHASYESVQFNPDLAQNVVFSDHSLATDSVFSEMHFVSCRNVLIYFERELQERAFHLFKDSLTRHGFLGLGSKETLQFSKVAPAFNAVVKEDRLYQKKE